MSPSGLPYQWRADGGYLIRPPSPPPSEEPPPPPYTPVNMICLPPQPVFLSKLLQPATAIPGPVGVSGLYYIPPTQQESAKPVPPPKPPQKREREGSGDEVSKKPKKASLGGPPVLTPGVKFLYPLETTRLHIFKKAARIWLPKYLEQDLNFKIWAADTQMTVRSMMQRVLGLTGDEAQEKGKGWVATEVLEGGDGKWHKGTSIEYSTDKAVQSLEDMSWNAKRGESSPPVWISIHKA